MTNGGIIGPKNNSGPYQASGMWGIREQYSANKNNLWQKQIVADGLFLRLDSANPSSYPGSGTIWYDLQNNPSSFATFTGTPSFTNTSNISFFSFSPGGTYAKMTTSGFTATDFSVNLWAKIKTPYEGGVRPRFFAVAETNFNLQFGYNELAKENELYLRFNGVFDGSLGTIIGSWTNYCVTRKSDATVIIYVNGVPQNPRTVTAPTANATINGIGNYTDNQAVTMDTDISFVSYYKKALSQEEVLENFNAIRGRYGI